MRSQNFLRISSLRRLKHSEYCLALVFSSFRCWTYRTKISFFTICYFASKVKAKSCQMNFREHLVCVWASWGHQVGNLSPQLAAAKVPAINKFKFGGRPKTSLVRARLAINKLKVRRHLKTSLFRGLEWYQCMCINNWTWKREPSIY